MRCQYGYGNGYCWAKIENCTSKLSELWKKYFNTSKN